MLCAGEVAPEMHPVSRAPVPFGFWLALANGRQWQENERREGTEARGLSPGFPMLVH